MHHLVHVARPALKGAFRHGQGDSLEDPVRSLCVHRQLAAQADDDDVDGGLDPAFWEAFPSFDDEAVAEAVAACARYAEGAVQRAEAGEDEPQRAAVEYTKLFVGPPSPAAAPWETMYRGKNVTVGFGQATFEMRELLREAGLEVRNVNNQYEDHLGIELLYLSSLCARADADAADAPVPESVADFIEKHPLSWVDAFRARIAEAAPDGYFVSLAGLARALLAWHAEALRV